MGLIRDPRIMQIILLSTYAILGGVLLQFSVTIWQIVITLGVCILLEFFYLYWKKGTFVWPYSAVITGLGISLALRAETIIPFIMAAMVAIGLKHLIRYQGSHIFNPSNSGIAVISILFPVTATDPLQWGYYLWILGLMSLGGLYLVYKAHRLPLVFTFFTSFVGIQFVRLLIWPDVWNSHFSTYMWGGLFIFTFNMITDPKTSPKGAKSQVIFGLAIALSAQIMIHMNIHNAVFISLAIVCLGRFLWNWAVDQGMFKGGHSSVDAK
ncbi:RnfABCDGE type electron transport complex subunit D [Virgibacillus sp. DJP39]|uniref:RnfABCDGE type electron transport complex subunit D n=1 Tax=Virgibacillus sp. DJP39 TaxID=3409790 RepID=UPI003BB4BFB7